MRRLRRHVDGELAGDPIEVGDAAARLDRRDVDARQVDVLLHGDVGAGERLVGGLPVADFPVEDAVVLLVLLVGSEHRGAGLERLERIDDDRQRVVVDFDGVDAIGGRVAIGGDDARHLLRLVHHLLGRQHHLGIRHQRRHPVEVVLRERLSGDDGEHAGDLQRALGIDRLDARVGKRAADDVQVEHARKLDVVHVAALPADEPRVLLALDGMTHPSDVGGGSRRHGSSLNAAVRRRTGST